MSLTTPDILPDVCGVRIVCALFYQADELLTDLTDSDRSEYNRNIFRPRFCECDCDIVAVKLSSVNVVAWVGGAAYRWSDSVIERVRGRVT